MLNFYIQDLKMFINFISFNYRWIKKKIQINICYTLYIYYTLNIDYRIDQHKIYTLNSFDMYELLLNILK